MQIEKKSFWGWGYEDFHISEDVIKKTMQLLQIGLGIQEFEEIYPPTIDEIKLPLPRFDLPESLKAICKDDTFSRASHSYGKSFRDVWRGLKGIYENVPDYIAYPKSEDEIQQLFEFATTQQIALIPYGGGSSVCGGVEADLPFGYKGCITVDMLHFDKVLEIDKTSRSARIQAGIYGLDLEDTLRKHELTLRHYPQSFEFSTLGGWIVTRSGGHYATLYTHVDEFVQSVRMLTPQGGILQSRRLPGSGAGPSEERLVGGSEGIFGIVTEAWMRLQDIPKYKGKATFLFKDLAQGAEACRLLAQSGLHPANARLIHALEAFSNGLGDGVHAVLIVGFESAHFPVGNALEKATQICIDAGGKISKSKEREIAEQADADEWKRSFIRAPYLRDRLMMKGLIVETFETAIVWDKFNELHQAIEQATYATFQRLKMKGFITCRFTHIYPDGPAPYYTIIAQGKKGTQLEEWDEIKRIVSDILIEKGATITHHHAVGRDHQLWYQKQAGDTFQHILRNIKTSVDSNWILNPGTLIKKI
ncbi:MAG: FAD-binding oxidoreductase [Chitinophagales bacterium]|nr:FAD-binding oxidoreductase [Chitinophagales bacterium]